MDTGKTILGALACVAAGAALGVLFAPEKGSDTRKNIIKKGEGYSDAIKDKFNDFVDNISRKYENLKEDVSEFNEEAKVKAEEIKRNIKTATA